MESLEPLRGRVTRCMRIRGLSSEALIFAVLINLHPYR
jgi:hypothetical protein